MDPTKIQALNQSPAPADSAATRGTTPVTGGASAPSKSITSSHDFLTLLVHQLQNQDPLNPMNDQDFAVQLAQFSSLEQLVDINKKLADGGLGGTSNVSSMASFLGREVVLKDQFVQVAGGKGPNVLVDLPAGIQSARVDLVNESGQVAKSYTLDDLTPGRKMITLENIDVGNGSYSIRAVGVNPDGNFVTLDSKVTGTVEGFVLDPQPALIVNGQQITMDNVKEVYVSPKQT